jgi:hypothetical protein
LDAPAAALLLLQLLLLPLRELHCVSLMQSIYNRR